MGQWVLGRKTDKVMFPSSIAVQQTTLKPSGSEQSLYLFTVLWVSDIGWTLLNAASAGLTCGYSSGSRLRLTGT